MIFLELTPQNMSTQKLWKWPYLDKGSLRMQLSQGSWMRSSGLGCTLHAVTGIVREGWGGGVEGPWAHLLSWVHPNHNYLLNHYWEKKTVTYQKRYSTSKTKKKAQWQVSFKETEKKKLLWWSSGCDPVLPMQGAQIPSLVKELRSCMPKK